MKKCFLLYYAGTNLYPPISLQRKSVLHLNSSEGRFAYFYIEEGVFAYPQINAPKSKTSYLFSSEIIDYDKENCINYEKSYVSCTSKDDCKLVTFYIIKE